MQPQADGPFEVLERINDNAYKIDLWGKYNVSGTFNVADLSPYLSDEDEEEDHEAEDLEDTADSRTNLFLA